MKEALGLFSGFYIVQLSGVPLLVGVSANLTANNKAIEVYPVTLAPERDVSQAHFVAIPNLGCEEACPPGIDKTTANITQAEFTEGLEGKIALIHRGTCSFGVKV